MHEMMLVMMRAILKSMAALKAAEQTEDVKRALHALKQAENMMLDIPSGSAVWDTANDDE